MLFSENDSDVDDSCDGCSESKEHCQCQNFLDEFCSWNKTLHSLGVLKKVCSDAFVSVIHTEVQMQTVSIATTFRGFYFIRRLSLAGSQSLFVKYKVIIFIQ